EIRGRADRDIFPERGLQVLEADEAVERSGRVIEVEENVQHADGPHTYLTTKFPLFDGRGRVFAVGGISTDITDLKRAEERFRQLVEASPSAMIMVGRDGKVVLVNALTDRLFGYERAELLGKEIEG